MAESRLNVRVDQAVKKQADQVFKRLGLNMSVGINIYLARVAAQQGIPFPLSLEVSSEAGEKVRLVEDAAQDAVRQAIAEAKAKGAPVALYDPVKKQPYLEYPDGKTHYLGRK
jgi:addiction module RelB/DinJ family antitoxin